MKPTELLMTEHRVIESVLDAAEAFASEVRAGRPVDLGMVEKVLDFIKTFADRCHHAKEEDILFEAMGPLPPVQVMRMEHDMGRAHVRAASDSLPGARQGDEEALRSLSEGLMGYVSLLREHIYKEDNILYPMANQMLGEDDQRRIEAQFEEVEQRDLGEGIHETYLAIAREVCEAASRMGARVRPLPETAHAHHPARES